MFVHLVEFDRPCNSASCCIWRSRPWLKIFFIAEWPVLRKDSPVVHPAVPYIFVRLCNPGCASVCTIITGAPPQRYEFKQHSAIAPPASDPPIAHAFEHRSNIEPRILPLYVLLHMHERTYLPREVSDCCFQVNRLRAWGWLVRASLGQYMR